MTLAATIRVCAAAAAVATLGGCGGPRQISDSGLGAYEVSLATWSDSLAVAWYDTRDGNAEVYVRALDAAGKELGAESRLTDSGEQSYEAEIAAAANGFAVAWYERAPDDTLRARLGFWDLERRPQWSVALGAAEHESRSPVVRIVGDALFCAWIERDEDDHVLFAQWWDLAGNARGAPLRIGPASANTWNLNAAVDGGGAPFVVFDALAGTKAHELFVARVEGERASLARLGADDGFPSLYPDIAFSSNGVAAITWFDERDGNQEVYLAAGAATELVERFANYERRVTATPGHSIGAYVAWNGERIGLAWSDDSSGSYEVYYRPFDERGDALGAQQRVTDNATDSLIPAIRGWRDGFALAWNEVSPAESGAQASETRSEVMFARVR